LILIIKYILNIEKFVRFMSKASFLYNLFDIKFINNNKNNEFK